MIKTFWRQLSLNQRIVFPFLAVSLSILMVGVLALGHWFTEGLEQDLRREVESFAERIHQDFDREWQDLSDQLQLIATQNTLQQAIADRDQTLLSQTLIPIKAALGFDWLKVVDTEGTVLLDIRTDQLNQANLSDTAITNSARAGANLTDLVLVQQSQQQQVLLAANHPIKTERLLGGLIGGRLVSDALLQGLAVGSSKELVALVDNQAVAKTLPDRWNLMFDAATAMASVVRIQVGNQGYLAKSLVIDGSHFFSILVLSPVAVLDAATTSLWLRLGLLLLLGGAIVIGVGFSIARAIARPIRRLTLMTQQLAQGDLTVRIPSIGKDEVGQLGNAFNQMAEQLAERGLLTQRIQQLQQMLSDLEKNQAQLIHAEKMSSLGQLVAGVAHEVNTPLGAIQASIGNITHSLAQSLKALPSLLQTLSPEQEESFFLLLDWVRQSKTMLSSREERQLRRTLKQTLLEYQLPQAEQLADTLSKMSITPAIAPILPLLQAPDVLSILETAYHIAVVHTNSQNIQLAVARATRIVYALKSYVRQDVVGVPIYASVAEGIDTVLTLYENQIKQGIEVEKSYAPLPQVLCYPEELAQVWSNLISNAIQAMNYQGKLAIATSNQDQHILVQITDSGKGIPPEIQAQIFEPFFTTKAMGEGTGLGLSIVKKIIDKHQGKIEVESQPGHTVFRVWLSSTTSPLPTNPLLIS